MLQHMKPLQQTHVLYKNTICTLTWRVYVLLECHIVYVLLECHIVYVLLEYLKCAFDSKHNDVGAGYFTAERDFIGFSAYNALPHSKKLCHINNESGIQSSLYQNRACWHKSCRDKYNSIKLKILRKWLDFNIANESVQKRTRLS